MAHIGEGRAMDEDDKELVRRLMAKATAMLEDAVEMTVAGQSDRLTASGYVRAACRLQAAARDIAVLAEAALIAANLGANRRRNWRKHPH